jgi:hypothetical protein
MATSGARPQRVTLASLMLVVAAAAVGIAWTSAYFYWQAYFGASWGASGPFIHRLRFYIPGVFPGLMMATLVLVLFQLIPPRPSARELLRSPGAASCLVVTLFFLFHAGCVAMRVVADRISLPGAEGLALPVVPAVMVGRLGEAGLAVAGAWLVLWSSQTRDGEPTWMEWAGRLLGVCWITGYVTLIVATSLI